MASERKISAWQNGSSGIGIPTSLRDSELGRPRWKHIQLHRSEDYGYLVGGSPTSHIYKDTKTSVVFLQ